MAHRDEQPHPEASVTTTVRPRRDLGRAVRLVDVALAAGVSPQTASNVIGGRTGFTESTRDRVLEAANQLGYTPNKAAQRLRTRRSHQLALHLQPDMLTVREPFAVSFLRAAIEAAAATDQQLVVFTTPLEAGGIESVLQTGVDGFVFFNAGSHDPRPRLFAERGIPFAVMGRLDPDLPQNCVDIDNRAAMRLVVDHLTSHGHRDIAYVGYRSRFYTNVERLAGVRAGMAKHGLRLPRHRNLATNLDAAMTQVTDVLLHDDLPDAIICSSDALAARAHAAITRAGLRPGTDVALTGFDGLPLAYEIDPPLTSVLLPLDAAAREVIGLLTRLTEGAPALETPIILETTLKRGGTA